MTSIESLDGSAKQKTRRFQFGLGTLLLLVLLGTMIWAAIAIQRAKKRDLAEANRQHEAVRAIASSGGIVLYDFEDDSRYVDKTPTDTRTSLVMWLHSILGADMFADVVKVHTGTSPTLVMTDATLTHLEQLPRLRLVELTATKITDEGLRHLEGLTQLHSLSLTHTNITGSGLRHLKGLSQLQSLDLTGTKVTDAGLEHLIGLTQLTELTLSYTDVSDTAVDSLQQRMPSCRIKRAR